MTQNLELPFDLIRGLTYEIKIEESDKTVFYLGGAKYIKFYDSAWGIGVSGGVYLQRFDRYSSIEKKRAFQIWPPKIVTRENPVFYDRKIWELWTSPIEYDGPSHIALIVVGHKDGFQPSDDYRKMLCAEAANRGILLTKNLLDQVFSPIEQKLMEACRQIKENGFQGE